MDLHCGNSFISSLPKISQLLYLIPLVHSTQSVLQMEDLHTKSPREKLCRWYWFLWMLHTVPLSSKVIHIATKTDPEV